MTFQDPSAPKRIHSNHSTTVPLTMPPKKHVTQSLSAKFPKTFFSKLCHINPVALRIAKLHPVLTILRAKGLRIQRLESKSADPDDMPCLLLQCF